MGRLKLIHRMWSLDPCSATRFGCSLAAFSGSVAFLAKRSRMTGAYVSFRIGIPITDAKAHRQAMMMKTHLTPILCAMKPPAIGPMTGPTSGPREYKAMAPALSRSEKRSPTLPPPIAMGAEPANPAAPRVSARGEDGNLRTYKGIGKREVSPL